MPLISPSHVIAYIAACVENAGTHVAVGGKWILTPARHLGAPRQGVKFRAPLTAAAPTGPYSFHLTVVT